MTYLDLIGNDKAQYINALMYLIFFLEQLGQLWKKNSY